MGIDLKIDHFTSCLEDSKTGKLVETSYKIASKNELSKLKGWNFNWLSKDLKECEIYKLTTTGNDNIQGLIALKGISKDNSVYVSLVESAPQNLGKSKAFYGVGGHLYAIAAQRSVELGYGGFFYMDAKNMELVAHYQDTLGAVLLGRPHPYRMFVDEENAKKLIKIYTLKEEL